jgi:hypothetical protein
MGMLAERQAGKKKKTRAAVDPIGFRLDWQINPFELFTRLRHHGRLMPKPQNNSGTNEHFGNSFGH